MCPTIRWVAIKSWFDALYIRPTNVLRKLWVEIRVVSIPQCRQASVSTRKTAERSIGSPWACVVEKSARSGLSVPILARCPWIASLHRFGERNTPTADRTGVGSPAPFQIAAGDDDFLADLVAVPYVAHAQGQDFRDAIARAAAQLQEQALRVWPAAEKWAERRENSDSVKGRALILQDGI